MVSRVAVTSNFLLLASLLALANFQVACLPTLPTPTIELCDCPTDSPSLQFFEYLQKHPLSMPVWHRNQDDALARSTDHGTKHVMFNSRHEIMAEEHDRPLPPPLRPDEVPLPTQVLMQGPKFRIAESGATVSPSAPTMTDVPVLISSTASGLPRLPSANPSALDAGRSPPSYRLSLLVAGAVLLFAVAVVIVEVSDRVWRIMTKERNPRRGRLRLRGHEQKLRAYDASDKEGLD